MRDLDNSQPINPADAAARRAFARYCSETGGAGEVAARHVISVRTVQRILNGERDVPPNLARRIADRPDTSHPVADAFLAWVHDCEQRTEARRG